MYLEHVNWIKKNWKITNWNTTQLGN